LKAVKVKKIQLKESQKTMMPFKLSAWAQKGTYSHCQPRRVSFISDKIQMAQNSSSGVWAIAIK